MNTAALVYVVRGYEVVRDADDETLLIKTHNGYVKIILVQGETIRGINLYEAEIHGILEALQRMQGGKSIES